MAEKLEGDRKKLREAVLSEKVATSKKKLSAWSYEIGTNAQKAGQIPSGGKLGLRYLLELSETFASSILTGIRTKAVTISPSDSQALHTELFRRFAVYDQRQNHQNVSKLLDHLFDLVPNKATILSGLASEFILSKDNSRIYSQ